MNSIGEPSTAEESIGLYVSKDDNGEALIHVAESLDGVDVDSSYWEDLDTSREGDYDVVVAHLCGTQATPGIEDLGSDFLSDIDLVLSPVEEYGIYKGFAQESGLDDLVEYLDRPEIEAGVRGYGIDYLEDEKELVPEEIGEFPEVLELPIDKEDLDKALENL